MSSDSDSDSDLEPLRLTFARTLKAVDAPSPSSRSNSRIARFTSLPPEIRIAIWKEILPDPKAEPPALFAQRHSYTWADADGLLEQPDGQVPIRMTTTCAALLHVNQESRHIVLSWAEAQGYELCYRVFCCDEDFLEEHEFGSEDGILDDEDHKKGPPVHGPIFIRAWDPSKDILQVFGTADDYGIPSEWDDRYLNGEDLRNVHHLAFSAADIDNFLDARWFYQLLAATPYLKSLSFEYDSICEADGETFHVRFIEARNVGNPWVGTSSSSDAKDDGSRRSQDPSPYVRWEAADCTPEQEMDFQGTKFKEQLIKGYLDPDYWPPERARARDSDPDDSGSVSGGHQMDVLETLPPWIWDRENGECAFEVRAFQAVERRGYDDVRGGLVMKCSDLYDWQ